MATTIKIREDTKIRLDVLKATLQLKGKKINQEDLIDILVMIAESHPLLLDRVIDWSIDVNTKERVLSNVFDLGPSSHKTKDEELYR
jgi:hypothetical protein